MIDTIDFSKLRDQSEDIFELIVVASKRAKQINALRVAQNPLPSLGKNAEETFEETPDEEEMINWDEIDKPVTVAVDEMLSSKIDYGYPEDESDEVEKEIKTDTDQSE